MSPENFGSVMINEKEYICEAGNVPPRFKDPWIAIYGIKLTIKNKKDCQGLIDGINSHLPSLIQYPRGELPLSECLTHRAIIETFEILEAPPYKGRPKKQEIKVNLVYRLWVAGDA